MKKLLLLACLCLLLAGCNPRSRRPSEDFLPSDWPSAAEDSRKPREETDPGSQPDDPYSPGLSGGTVKRVYFKEGDFTYQGTDFHYSYAFPMVDLPSQYAMGVNQEIEFRFGNPVRDSVSNMEHYEPPVVQTVRYTEDIFGSVLTVRIYRTDVDGMESQGIYSLNAVTGEEPTYQEFLAAAGLQENLLHDLLAQAVEIRFRELVGNRFRETDHRFTNALNQSLGGITDPSLLPRHLTEEGKLALYVTVYDPGGGSDLQEFVLP